MSKERRKLQHIHSSIADKQPTPSSIEVGEIAINNFENKEFISIKNTNNKVVRFSSDGQMIDWVEKKEVIPYQGYVRGSNSSEVNNVTNSDLLQNKSNIIIKLNQVTATNTNKHDKVNGAKDIYGNLVNPSNDGGITDGAGFAIDMSRYAMIGANPSFSSLTVANKSELSGNTTIYGNLTVTGNTNISGECNVDGNVSIANISAETLSATNLYASGEISGVSGNFSDKVTSVNGFFQTSDARFKKNIKNVSFDKALMSNKIEIKQFNYNDDETNRLVYGIIAQEAEENGLDEIVYTDETDRKAVDYTSLTMLKLAYLENENKLLRTALDNMNKRLEKLENKSNG